MTIGRTSRSVVGWIALVAVSSLVVIGCALQVESFDRNRLDALVGQHGLETDRLGEFQAFEGRYPITLGSRGRGSARLLDNNFFFLPVELNGARGELLVDTGAPFAVIQPEFAARANIPISEEGFLWTLAQFHPRLFELRLGVVDRFRIGTAEAQKVPVLVPTDQVVFRMLGLSTGELGGLLGWVNLRNLVTTFDFETGAVTLDPRPFANREGYPVVPVKIYTSIGAGEPHQGLHIELRTEGGATVEALFDTGSGRGLIVPETLARSLGVTQPDTLVPVQLGRSGPWIQAETRSGGFDLVVLSLDVFARNGYRQVILDMIQRKIFLVPKSTRR